MFVTVVSSVLFVSSILFFYRIKKNGKEGDKECGKCAEQHTKVANSDVVPHNTDFKTNEPPK